MPLWRERVNSEELKTELLRVLEGLYRKTNIKLNNRYCPKYWQKRESFLPKVRMRLIDIPVGLYLIVYKDLMRHEMAIAYEERGVLYEALIENLDLDLNLRIPSFYNVYYFAVYPDGSREILQTVLFPKNRYPLYNSCGFLARCMPKVVFNAVWGVLKKFSIV